MFAGTSITIAFGIEEEVIDTPFIIGSLFKIASCCNLKCFDQRVTTLLQGMAIFRCFISVQLQVIESEKCRCFHQLFEGSVDKNTDLFNG